MGLRPRAIITRVIVFLLLGAVVNVAVAWGFACLANPVGPHVRQTRAWLALEEPQVQQGQSLEAFVERRDTVGTTRLRSFVSWADRSLSPADSITAYWASSPEARHLQRGGLNINASGWPLRCLMYRWNVEGTLNKDGTFGPPNFAIVGGVELTDFPHASSGSRNVTYLRALPYQPIWPGFAINTLFYAAILWVIFAAPFALRHRRRFKRGLCPACAYPVGDSPVCTECGKALTHRTFGSGPHH